jgi:pilus assembly protein CpaB
VDVLLTLDRGENRPQSITRTILQNVTVLAAGQQVQRDKEGKPQTVTVVTLLLTLEDAELLVLAGKEGRIQLALRNTLDTLSVATAGAKADQLAPGSAAPRPRVASPNRVAAPAPRVNNTVIEGYKGGERTLTTFQKP